MRRLILAAAYACIAAAIAAQTAVAQQREKLPVIGIMANVASDATPNWQAFREALTQSGRVEGRNIKFEFRSAMDDPSRLSAVAAELAGARVDAIVTTGLAATRAAARATRTIAIVQASGGDLLQTGLVAANARPGGNVTGFTNLSLELGPKRLQLLQEAFPKTRRVALLVNRGAGSRGPDAAIAAAQALGLAYVTLDVRSPAELRGLRPSALEDADALLVVSDNMFASQPALIVRLAAASRLPALYPETLYVAEGGLMAYGIDLIDNYRRAAGYVDRILKGEKAGDLPVQQPTKFWFSVNLKTARTLDLPLPPTLVAAADEVIE